MTPAERLRQIIETGDPGTAAGVQLTRWVCNQLPKTEDGEFLAYRLEQAVKLVGDCIQYGDVDISTAKEQARAALAEVERATVRLVTS